MKKKQIIINVLLSMTVLFSILFQSVHSYEHHFEFAENHCDHQYSKNKTEVSHGHHITEQCVVCHFNFSSFTTTSFYTLQFYKKQIEVNFTLFNLENHSTYFKGSLFSLRAPPLF